MSNTNIKPQPQLTLAATDPQQVSLRHPNPKTIALVEIARIQRDLRSLEKVVARLKAEIERGER